MRETDRRVKYTKMVLRESLLELLQTKPINRISVTELCNNADVNRGTFYAHYSDPYDLLRHIEDELYNDLHDCLSENVNQPLRKTTTDMLLVLNRNREICRVVLGANSNTQFMQRIYNMCYEFFGQRWSCAQAKLPLPEEYLYRFIASGNIELIRHWLMNDETRSPEDIAAMITTMMERIMQLCMEGEQPAGGQ